MTTLQCFNICGHIKQICGKPFIGYRSFGSAPYTIDPPKLAKFFVFTFYQNGMYYDRTNLYTISPQPQSQPSRTNETSIDCRGNITKSPFCTNLGRNELNKAAVELIQLKIHDDEIYTARLMSSNHVPISRSTCHSGCMITSCLIATGMTSVFKKSPTVPFYHQNQAHLQGSSDAFDYIYNTGDALDRNVSVISQSPASFPN